MSSSKDLKGKVAIVTGATSGIGLETAANLAGRGATVILGCRNPTAAKGVAEQIMKRCPGSTVDASYSLDLISQDSVRKFAAEINKKYSSLDILVNNAGVSFMNKTFTDDGVGGIAQTNHLGPYTLTRLLEKKLASSKARVVTVASVTHRTTSIKDAKAFLTDWRSGYYQHSKLANVYFGYELARRLGPKGVQSCVADPGGVRSGIWDASPIFKKGFLRMMVDMCYSPPSDGCQAVVHAATVPWSKDVRPGVSAENDLRYYSRGMFAWPCITSWEGVPKTDLVGNINSKLWGMNTAFLSLLDWPIRRLSGCTLLSTTSAVKSAKATYDKKIAADLWDESADLAKLPRTPDV